ncbi:hypothetical protein IAI17_41720, partial [Escherichia coli]|nr:hypothetical protein [Escherichia coli]
MPLFEDGAAGYLQRRRGIGVTERPSRTLAPQCTARDWCRSGNRVRTFPALLTCATRDYDGCQTGPA